MTITDIWQELEVPASRTPGIFSRRVREESRADLFVGISRPEGHRMFILGIDTDATLSGQLPSAKGIRVGLIRPSSGATPLFVVELVDPQFQAVFTVLVEDLVKSASEALDSVSAMEVVVARLTRWQRLLDHGSGPLAPEAQRGLYGELFFMRHLAASLGITRAVDSWTGPSRAPQDFQCSGWAVEVKTTGAEQPQRIRVAGARQLDDTGLSLLAIYHLSLDVREAGQGDSLAAMVSTLRDLAATHPAAAQTLEDRLLDAGYLDHFGDQYARAGYTVRAELVYKVRDGFPRLLEAMLPSGVGDVTYTIDASACAPYAVPLSHLLGGLRAP